MARARSRPRPRHVISGVLVWVAITAILAGVGWLWWRAATPPSQEPDYAWEGADEPAPRGGADPEEAAEERPVPPPSQAAPATNVITPPLLPPAAPVPAATNAPTPPPRAPPSLPRDRIVAVQIALARRGISSGSIDGVVGSQTRAALRVFQRLERLPVTGQPDEATLARLSPPERPYTESVVTAGDLARLMVVPTTWLGKSYEQRLDYETVLELVAERSHAHPNLIRQLNPRLNWYAIPPGTAVLVPDARSPSLRQKAAFVRIRLGEKTLQAYDASSNLLVHFPCSIARRIEKRPVGQLRVQKLAPNPNYRFDPEIFRESAEARRIGRRLILPPGPNNPVGTAWIGLSRPGYGIHGTPRPEEVGRTESHGCFRLANWNAELLLKLSWVGMPVHVEP